MLRRAACQEFATNLPNHILDKKKGDADNADIRCDEIKKRQAFRYKARHETVQVRPCGNEEPVSMIGFPYRPLSPRESRGKGGRSVPLRKRCKGMLNLFFFRRPQTFFGFEVIRKEESSCLHRCCLLLNIGAKRIAKKQRLQKASSFS